MVCRFNPFYIGPAPPSCCTDLKSDCDCPPCSPDTGYQEPRPVHEECNPGVSKKENKESKCNPPCKEAPKKEKKEKKSENKDAKKTK
ncbi:uncharacterized protein LOC6613242 isoform X2 [Drosophila sechellia]|uniref:GM18414 n=1 Tax=Drosophila sechellia TaxID=7238 RepID=B4I2Z2_DROSE|nr:uncharacterized protein LOC6613242 isoform X2 [Drosophila sechellia]EDW54137.1 GM18414 [Drosophila sechellia]